MSTDIIDTSTMTEDIDPIVEDGQVSEQVELESETPVEEQELFDFTDIGEKFVKLQVDGQEVTVPIKEAFAGYSRQADYTRKTQELAEQRKQVQFAATLQESLQNDPAGTLQALQEHYGITTTAPAEEEWLDDNEKQFRSLEQRIAAFESDKAMTDLTKTIDSLKSKYGEDFNAEEIVAKALLQGSDDLEAIFKQVAFDKIYSKSTEATKKLATEQARLNAKRGANIVSGATSSQSTSKPNTAQAKTVFEAFEAAKKTLGISD